jgi:sec-independent protein translocase protein TatA
MFGIGMPELIIIGIIVLIIFGAGKIPQIGGGIGQAIRNFKDAVKSQPEAIEASKDVKKEKTEGKA